MVINFFRKTTMFMLWVIRVELWFAGVVFLIQGAFGEVDAVRFLAGVGAFVAARAIFSVGRAMVTSLYRVEPA